MKPTASSTRRREARSSSREAWETRGRTATTYTSRGALETVSQETSSTREETLTAKDGGGAPRPAGFATPGPALSVDGIPPGALFPRRALGSVGGGDSTEREMM